MKAVKLLKTRNEGCDSALGGWKVIGRRLKILRKQTQQVVENTGEMSGNGQNNPNIGHCYVPPFLPANLL